MADGQIKYSVGFDVQKEGLNQLKTSLQELQKLTEKDLMRINSSDLETARKDLHQIRVQAQNVRTALRDSFNAKLNTHNIESFNKSLEGAHTTIEDIYKAWSAGGTAGQNAFRSLSSQVLSTNIQLKQTNGMLDKMAQTFVNVAKYNFANTVIRGLSSSVQQAFGYVKSLDTSLNNIRIVTGKSADEMQRFAEQANNAAKNLGSTTTDYTNAALIYAQQGLSDKEVQARTAITLKTANVTGQSAAEVSEQLTAVWNGYKVNADQAQVYVDRLAAVAATTASDLEELSKGMGKVASAAATMGVSEEQLAAQLSTIISATKQAPESVGTALRTVYARISDIQAGIDEEGVSLGNYSGKMAALGFSVLDMNGKLRDMGEVMEEIGGRWDTLTREQQVYLAQTMAGQRQYNNLLSLFDNFDEYNKALDTARNATGTLQEQQDIYMDSTAAHLQQLKASVEDIYDSLVDTDTIKSLTDGLSTAATFAANFVDSLGGGAGVLQTLGALGVSVFSEQIAKGINSTISGFQMAKSNAQQFQQALDATREWQGIEGLDDFSKKMLEKRQQLYEMSRLMTPQQFTETQTSLNNAIEAGNQLKLIQDQREALESATKALLGYKDEWKTLNDIQKDPEGQEKILDTLQKQIEGYQAVIDKLEEYRDKINSVGKEANKIKDEDFTPEDQANYLAQAQAIRDQMKNTFDSQVLDMQANGQLNNYEEQIKEINNEFKEMDSLSFAQLIKKLMEVEARIRGIMNSSRSASTELAEGLSNSFNYTKNSLPAREDAARRAFQQNESNVDESLLNTSRAIDIEKYTKIAGGITQVGMAIQQVQRLGSIWKNADLSTGQKFIQILTNASMSALMFGRGMGQLVKSFGLVSMASKEETLTEIAHAGALGLVQTEAGKTAISIQTLNGVLLVNPFVAAAAAIMTVVTALSIMSSAAEEARKAQIELNNTKIEDENKIQERVESERELFKSLDELDQKYKEGEISRTDLKSSIQDLVGQYDLQEGAVTKLTSSYTHLHDAILETRKEQLEAAKKSAEREKETAEEQVKYAANNDYGGFVTQGAATRYSLEIGTGLSYTDEKDAIYRSLKESGAEGSFGGILSFNTDDDINSIIALYDQVSEAINRVKEAEQGSQYYMSEEERKQSEYFQNASKWLNQMSEQIQAYKKSILDAQTYTAEFAAVTAELEGKVDFSKINNFSDYQTQRQNVYDAMQTAFEQEGKGDVFDKNGNDLVDSYLLTNFGDLYNQYNEVSQMMDKITKKAGPMSDEIKKSFQAAMEGMTPEQLDKLSQYFEISPATFDSWEHLIDLIQKANSVNEQPKKQPTPQQQYLESLQDQATEGYNLYQSLEDQVKGGKNISKSEYQNLPEQVQEYFSRLANGTYKMKGDAEQFYNLINNLKTEGFKNAIDQIQNKLDSVHALQEGNFDYEKVTGRMAVNQDQHNRRVVDTDLLQEQVDYLSAVGGAPQELISQWQEYIANQEVSDKLAKQIYEKVQATTNETGNLTDQQEKLTEQARELERQLHDAMFPLDQDVDETAVGALAKNIQAVATESDELADRLSDGTEEAQRDAEDLAESILRFDDAIQDVSKNYDDWKKSLESGSWQDQAEAMDGLRDAYADLLDMDGSALPETFLKSTENLNLMKAAAEGSEQAYDQLMQKAQQQIAAKVGLDTTAFQIGFDHLMDCYYQGQSLDDLQIGASLDNAEFLNGLTEMVNAAGMTAQEATNYLASMGVDAQVIEQDTEAEEKSEAMQYHSTLTPKQQTAKDTVLSNSGGQLSGTTVEQSVTSWDQVVEAIPVPGTAKKQNKAFSLKVTSAHKSSGGGMKFKHASNGGGSKGGSSGKGGKGRGGGGGKGGGGKAAKPDTSKKDPKKPLETQKDIYHDINIELKQIQRDLERVQKVQDRLYGKQLIDNLNKQVAILDKQKEKLKQKQKIQEQDLKNQQKTLKNLGATFDKYGNINNYLSLIQEKQKAVNTLTARANKIIEEYNASTDAEYKKKLAADIEAYNKQIQKAQEDLKNTQSKISNYDKLREQMQDLVDDIEEITQKQIEINIKKFRTEVQIRLDMGEAERDWNDFVRNVINSDDILKDTNFDKVFEDAKQNLGDLTSYFETKQVEALANKMMQTRQQIESIDATGTSSIYGDNKAQAMQDLQNDLKDLQDQMKDISDLIQDIDEAILDTVDDIDDQLDERLEAYEFVQDLIEHDLDLMDLLYGDRNYDAMDSYYKQLQKNELDRLNLLRLQGEFWKKNYEDAIANGQTNLAKEYEKNYKDAIKNINSVIEESIKTLTDKYTNAINKIFDDLNKKITSGKGLDYLDKQWQLMTKNADEYLDAINAAFGIQQIESKFIDAINNTDTLKGQRALKKVMDQQLNNLRAKEKLTQYDVDRAEKLLQIEQARIALEAAQSSKTSLRLQRDSQGNYSYHYVADQQGISEAEDNYNQAVNDLYNFDKDKYRDNLQQMLAAWQEFQSEYTDIKTDMSLSDEERLERLALLEEQYGEYINGLAQQNTDIRVNLAGSAVNDLANLYAQDAANYEAMTLEERESLVQNLLVPWSEGIQEMINYLNGEGGFLPVTQDSFEELTAITRDYEAELAQMAAEAGVDLDMVSQGVDQVKDEFELLGMENADLIYLMYNELNAILDLRNAAQNLVTEYQHICNAAIQAVTEIQAFIQKQQEAAASYQQTAAAYQAMIIRIQNANASLVANPMGDYTGSDNGGSSGGGSSGGGSGGSGSGRSGSKNLAQRIKPRSNNVGYAYKSSSGVHYTGHYMDTGGYTGEWNSDEGKLAVLHEKQIVLNKEDTKNFLDGIMVLRQITSNLGGSIYAKVSRLKSNYFNASPNDEIQQKVQISASFPNVNSKRQIEEAFNDLVNLAAQRAMRR